MERLIQKSEKKIRDVSTDIERYLLSSFKHDNQITILKGARGVGKTTFLLQYGKKLKQSNHNVLYVALDDLFFQENSLYELAEEFVLNNGDILLLDEVHKYPNWSRELKLIYDDLSTLKLVVTSSSLLEIYKSESDLSRRAVSYTMKELSFREYLIFEKGMYIEAITLEALLADHVDISYQITKKIKPIYEFNKYITSGMYPYYWEDTSSFHDKLRQTINLTLEVDLPTVEAIDYNHIVKLKRLLYAISNSAPFTPNISKLSERVGMSRKALVKALHYLDRARLITLLNKPNKGISILSKPDKIFLNNPNIHFAIDNINCEKGSMRESFFVNQIKGLYKISLSEKADFIVDDTFTFEIGGKNKKKTQIQNIPNAYIVKDNIENGISGVIPLWMFGLLY